MQIKDPNSLSQESDEDKKKSQKQKIGRREGLVTRDCLFKFFIARGGCCGESQEK